VEAGERESLYSLMDPELDAHVMKKYVASRRAKSDRHDGSNGGEEVAES
jgi:hypothetical protein